MASLSIEKVAKSFGPTQVLREISFDVADGEFCVLLGPSGCGKTTLLRIIAGLESLSRGVVRIGNQSVEGLQPRDRDVAFVFQNYALYPHMTVAENLGFSLQLRGVAKNEAQARITETARLLEIEPLLDRKPQQLSGGQRQRVALGRAIVRRPKLFLFDEPLSNLDATLRTSMRLELAKLHERLGATMLYVTHDQAEAMTLGDSIIVLNQGAVQQRGTPAAIYHRPANTFVAGFVGNPRMNLIEGQIEQFNERLKVGKTHLGFPGLLSNIDPTHSGASVTIGIRPEDFYPCEEDQAAISGNVTFIEDLGSNRFVHLTCGNLTLVARLPAKFHIKRGDILHLAADPQSVHLFYEDQRLDPVYSTEGGQAT